MLSFACGKSTVADLTKLANCFSVILVLVEYPMNSARWPYVLTAAAVDFFITLIFALPMSGFCSKKYFTACLLEKNIQSVTRGLPKGIGLNSINALPLTL